MGLFHHITVFLISEQEKSDFLKTGVEFSEITRGPSGESAIFEIEESDPRWPGVVALIDSLEACEGIPEKYRVQNLTMKASMNELRRRLEEGRIKAESLIKQKAKFLKGYSAQSVEQLLSLESEYRIDSLVLAFEEAIGQKAGREGTRNLTEEENVILAVEALEREVNNGGYHQFFINSSQQFVPIVVSALQRIGCNKTAAITEKAIKTLGISDLNPEAIDMATARLGKQLIAKLEKCDDSYYKSAEPIADRLFSFIKINKAHISL